MKLKARNTPLGVISVAETLARLRGESVETIAAATYKNALEAFGLNQ